MKLCPRCAIKYNSGDWICPECGFAPVQIEGFPALAPELAISGAGFQPSDFAKLADLEAGSFWFRSRNRLILWALHRNFPDMHRYMEIGCGTGYVLAGVAQAFPQAELTGSEVFSVGLSYAANRVQKAKLLQMDARRIPFVEEFDVIGCFDVLEHIEEDEAVLAEMLRAIRPGGGIAITVPQHPWLWSDQDEHACHVRRYRVGEIREKVLRAGFKVEFETSFVSLLLPVMIASRKVRFKTRRKAEALAELQLPGFLNWTFVAVMKLERMLLLLGLRFPVGGSVLLIASKAGTKV